MAGIGFVLRRLAKKGTLTASLQAYFHAAIATSGPWLFTVIAIASFFIFTRNFVHNALLEQFRGIILYNFGFSLVFAGPFTLAATRFLADCFYEKDITPAPAMLIGSLTLLFATISIPVYGFYFLYTKLAPLESFLASVNFFLVAAIWQTSVFLSALKNYKMISLTFLVGMFIAVIATALLGPLYQLEGMLAGFSLGLALILSALIALIFAEYPKAFKNPFSIVSYFWKYWPVVLGGALYNLGIWADKWIMWFSDEAIMLPIGLIMYPNYDTAMFLAYLSVVPALAFFMVQLETAFFELYIQFYDSIQQHAPYRKIEENYQELMQCLSRSVRNLIALQSVICVTLLFCVPKILDFLNLSYIHLGIMRFGLLGASLQIVALILSILLSYFDDRKGVLIIQATFCVANALFTFFFMKMGFPYYGLGYFLASLGAFIMAAVLLERYTRKLIYAAFITSNRAID